MSQSPAPARKKPGPRGLGRLLAAGTPGRMAGDKIQRGVLAVAIVLLVAMIVVAVLLGLDTRDGGAGVASFVLFAAAAAVGAGLGFLFGMPRARVAEMSGDGTGGPTAPAPATTSASTYYLTNSNLIKVSDWLTTIVIGLGLVNLGKVVPAVRQLGHALHQPLGNAPYSGAVGVSVMLIGLLAGFILNYLWTSIRVRELLEESERQQEHVPELRDRTIADARREMAGTGLKLLVPPGVPDSSRVAGQTLAPGTVVPPGTSVAVLPAEPATPPDRPDQP